MARRLLILVGALVVTLALPATARAETFCVNAPGCQPAFEHDTLDTALVAADAAPEKDEIRVGPGEYPGPFRADADNAVEIVGVGQGESVLTASGDPDPVISLAAPSSAL